MAHVLVVDDDPDLLTLVELQLRHQGHKVVTAPSGPDAIALVTAQGVPDLAVLDVAMPGMNGLELLGHLRAIDGAQQLPAIFLSARVGAEDIEAGRSLGAEYLTKPYAMNALIDTITSVLASRAGV